MSNNLNLYWLLLVSAVIVASFSQILLKKSAMVAYGSLIKEYLNPYVIGGYGMMVVSTLLVVLAYSHLEYKNGPIIESSGFILVMLLSRWFLGEKLTRNKILGNAIILLGIVIFYI